MFGEDFETGALDPRFTVYDSNAASGLDYWDISGFRANGGQFSAWAAQVGNQSSGAFVGRNNSDAGVQLYDDNMDADLVVNLQVNGFGSLTLSFFYFIRTESGGGDWIQAWYEAGGVQTNIFDPRGSTGNSWANVSLNVPNNIDQLIIRFHTDAANHGFEGAYVDDIVLTGVEDVPPTSTVSALPTYTNDEPFLLPFTAQDNANASGVDYVELWYRYGSTGNWTLYTQPARPLGRWSISPIAFDASYANGNGYYEFYTIAVDNAGNAEATPSGPDASVTIDTVSPTLTASWTVNPQVTDAVTIAWQASDNLSGIDHYELNFDAFGFVTAGTTTSREYTGLAPGEHTVTVRVYDRAGNVEDAVLTFTTGPGVGFPWWILALIAGILLGGLILFVWWRRRKEQASQKVAARESASERAEERARVDQASPIEKNPPSEGSPPDDRMPP